MTPRRVWAAVAILAAVAAGTAIWVNTELFPYHSLNHDEAVYLQQAEMLLEGQIRLYPPVEDAFRPWFFVEDGDTLYAKYTLPTAALWAFSHLLTGTWIAGLVGIAAAGVALMYGVVREAFDRKTGIVAAALLTASPLFIIHSGTYLSYLPTTVANLGFAFCYFRAQRRDDRRFAALAGALIGLAFFARPYTAVLFALPFIGHALVVLVGTGLGKAEVIRQGITAAMGLLGVLAALGYNWLLTGDPMLFPYQAFAPLDGLGFGTRRLLGYEIVFTPELGLRSSVTALWLLWSRWVVGGILGTALAVLGLARLVRRSSRLALPSGYSRRQAQWTIAAVTIPVVIGNIAFWGTFNAFGDPTNPAGLGMHLGPFYHLDLLLPTVALAAWGVVGLWDWAVPSFRSRLGEETRQSSVAVTLCIVVVVASLGGATILVATDAFIRNQTVTETYTDAYQPFEEESFSNGVIFLPQTYGPWLNHPYQPLRNDPGYDEGPVYALQEEAPFAVADTFPERELYRFVRRGPWAPTTDAPVTTAVRPVDLRRAERVDTEIRFGVPDAYEAVSLRLSHAGEQATYAVNLSGDSVQFSLRVTPEGIRLTGPSLSQVSGPESLPAEDGRVVLRAFLDVGTGAGATYHLETPVQTGSTSVAVMTPYREMCFALQRCGGSAAAIPGATPPGLWIETQLSIPQESLLRPYAED